MYLCSTTITHVITGGEWTHSGCLHRQLESAIISRKYTDLVVLNLPHINGLVVTLLVNDLVMFAHLVYADA